MTQVKIVKYVSLFLISFLSLSCGDEEIGIEKLAKVYVDLSVVEDYYNESDSLVIKKEEIFKKYSISENEYKNSFIKIGSDKEKWDQFYKLANTYLDTLKANLKNSAKKIK